MVWLKVKRKLFTTIIGFTYGLWWLLHSYKRKWVIVRESLFDDDQQIDAEMLPMLCRVKDNDGPLYMIEMFGFRYTLKFSHLFFIDRPLILSNRTIRKIIRAAESFAKAEKNKGRQSNLRKCNKLIDSANSDLGNPVCRIAKKQLEEALDLIKEYHSRKDYTKLPDHFFKHLGAAISSLLGL